MCIFWLYMLLILSCSDRLKFLNRSPVVSILIQFLGLQETSDSKRCQQLERQNTTLMGRAPSQRFLATRSSTNLVQLIQYVRTWKLDLSSSEEINVLVAIQVHYVYWCYTVVIIFFSVIVILPVLSTVRSRHHVFLPSTVPDMLQFAHSLRLIVRATQLGVASFAVREVLDEEQSSFQQATVRWNPPKK